MTTSEHRDANQDPIDALLVSAAASDRIAFAAFYDATVRVVYGLVLRVVRDPARSEDVVQETYLAAWRHAGRFDPTRGRALSWISTIAHRRAVDLVRSEQASRDRSARVAAKEPVSSHDEVAEEVEQRAELETVRGALTELTELQREAIELAFYDGYTYREVAEILDAPLGTVKTRMRDGLRKLARAVGAHG